MFYDRKDAGERLAHALIKYKGKGAIVLAIPRGGVEVGYEVARFLEAPFSILVSRKLPYPDNPEAGFGAITEDGTTFFIEEAAAALSKETIEFIKEEQRHEVSRRITVLRGSMPLPDIHGKTVILVDDGLAMGSTMMASITFCRKNGARKIVSAVPIAGQSAARLVGKAVDDIVVLEMPEDFMAVAQGYKNWHDVSDSEVRQIMKGYDRGHKRDIYAV